MNRFVPIALGGVLFAACGAPEAKEVPTNTSLETITGFYHPEDLEVLPGGNLLLVSEYGGLNGERPTVLSVIDLESKRRGVLFPKDGAVAPGNAGDVWGSADCPGAPPEIAPHGIHMGRRKSGEDQLLVVNHRGREAIEFFELTGKASGDPGLVWRGCVVAPDTEVWFNDVAALPGNGFAVTHMMPHGAQEELLQRAEGDRAKTGYVLQWLPSAGWSKVPRSEGAINNGIQASDDGATLYVAHFLGDQVVAIERETGDELWVAEMSSPDNLSFAPDGRLLVASIRASLAQVRECSETDAPVCSLDFAVVSVDPSSGATETLLEGGSEDFGAATVAVEAGNRLVMGSFSGDRIAVTALPKP